MQAMSQAVTMPPHGGKLVDRVLRDEAREEATSLASSLPRIALNARTMSDLELIAVGAYSPLEGFMGEADYRSVLHDMRLAGGLAWPLPITLAVRRSAADTLREGEDVALVSPREDLLGILHLEERFPYDGREEARLVYGTEDPRHPGAEYQLTRGEVLLAGKVDLVGRLPLKGFEPYRLDPAESRARFQALGWRTVVGFQSQQPIHRAHEYIQKCALEPLDGLLIHPLVGKTKLDELASEVRVRCYQVLVEQYYPKDRVILAVFPGAMRYAGPRETLFQALVRKNYGCTHFIVGREYAAIETASAPLTVDEIFRRFAPEALGVIPLFFDETFYCRRCEAVTSPKTCPHATHTRMALSGALIRELLGRGEMLPSEFARPEVAEILPEILNNLWRCGLNSMGSCGDVTRNITGCPLAGVDGDELVDASPLVQAATRMLNGNADFYNLPRKYKISITGCQAWCSYPEINDIGMTAIRHPETGEVGFSVRVGGGLSTDPHLAVRLDAFVHWNQVLPVVRGISELFRDSAVLRENREKARLKFLFLAHGWTAQRFQEELERRIGFHLDPAVHKDPPDDVYRDHVGIHDQKQSGYCHVGLPVLRGRLTPGQMRTLADVADRYGSGELRTTSMQNILIPNVRRERAQALARAIEAAGLRLEGSPFWRGTIACTGTEFCKLALTETKNFARWLVEDLETRLPGFDQHVKIHVTGCPNSCGQHWIADIGIEGKKVKVEGQMVDAYYFCVGGGVGKHQAKARPIGYRIAAAEVPGAIERLLRVYLGDRRDGENFRQFSARHTDEALRAFLAWEPVAPVARDASPGRPPRDVDG